MKRTATRARSGLLILPPEVRRAYLFSSMRRRVVRASTTRSESYVGGLDTLLEPSDWEPIRTMTAAGLAVRLVEVVRHIPLATIRKAKRGPKKPVPKRTRFKGKPHVSTKRLLERYFQGDS